VPFACLFVPDYPVQAVVRLEPELRGKAVGVLAGALPLTKVFSVNTAARKLGVEAGLTKAQAEAFNGIVWRWRSLPQEATAHAALLDCAWSVSPRVEDGARNKRTGKTSDGDFFDTVVLDIAGCEKLFGPPEKIAHDLQRFAAEVGFDANVAVASNPSAAISAARSFSGVVVIPPGEESSRIGALSLAALGIPPDLEETLKRWGIHTCAQFAALPEIAIVERMGQEGRHWQRLAQGVDSQPLLARRLPAEFEECMELEPAVELLEPLLFVLNRLLDQLCARLRLHLLAISEIKVTLTLERNYVPDDSPGESKSASPDKGRLLHVRTLRLPAPARESKFLLKLLQLDLQAHPPAGPVIAAVVLAVPATARSRQLGLFLPLSPEPERLEVTLARLQSTVGEGRVGAPVLLDTHRPGAFDQRHFVLPEMVMKRLAGERPPRAALRIYRPPLPASVDFADGKPAYLACEDVRRQILSFSGPWRTKGDWWSETVWARDEWDVRVRALRPKFQPDSRIAGEEETAVYRIYRDRRLKRWFVEGIYD